MVNSILCTERRERRKLDLATPCSFPVGQAPRQVLTGDQLHNLQAQCKVENTVSLLDSKETVLLKILKFKTSFLPPSLSLSHHPPAMAFLICYLTSPPWTQDICWVRADPLRLLGTSPWRSSTGSLPHSASHHSEGPWPSPWQPPKQLQPPGQHVCSMPGSGERARGWPTLGPPLLPYGRPTLTPPVPVLSSPLAGQEDDHGWRGHPAGT